VRMSTTFKWSRLRAFLALAAAGLAVTAERAGRAHAVAPPERMHVLCLASEDCRSQGLDDIDPKAVEFYRDLGFELHFDFYQRVDAARLEQFPVVVGMMPMLFPGTRAIDDRLAAAIDRYVQGGGGFLLLPAPGYYAGEDFLRQLNPWLARFGCTLVNDHPHDPENVKKIVRVLGYRYLKAGDVWLPLDTTDAYVTTHTMRLTDEWDVIVRGAASCSTRTFREDREGAYASAPPFLAVRSWGAGSIGVFTTSSQYFIFDAFHPAYGDGWLLRDGGGQLMTRLLSRLASGTRPPPPQAEPAHLASGNVPVSPDRGAWFEVVRRDFTPSGHGVRHYVDCGSLTDLPYSPERGCGRVGSGSWLLRWPWAEEFHATGANVRSFASKPLVYRFSGLDAAKHYRLGLLVWAYKPEAAGAIRVEAGGETLDARLRIPRFVDKEGPAFVGYDLPRCDRQIDVSFSLVDERDGSFASVGEVWLFERGAVFEVQESLPTALDEQPADRKAFRGLVGPSGDLTTAAAVARSAGHDFIVVLQDVATIEDVEAYRRQCAAASDKTFIAVPGVAFSGEATAADDRQTAVRRHPRSYSIRPLASLPTAADRLERGAQLPWRLFSGEWSGGASAPLTLARASRSEALSRRFWRGFDLTPGEEDDAIEAYVDLVSSGYGPWPRASSAAERGREWCTTFFARRREDIVDHQSASCIDDGPRIRSFGVSSDHERDAAVGGAVLFRGQAWLVVHADIESSAPIESVTLYSGHDPLRIWHPGSPTVRIEEPVLAARNHQLWMRVRAADGSQAMSGVVQAQESTFRVAMCSDNQNSICSLARQPLRFERDERSQFLQHSYWHTGEAAGQLGVMRDAAELVPRVIETGIVQPVKSFVPTPVLRVAGDRDENHLFGQMRILSGDGDHNRIEYRTAPPAGRLRSNVLLTSFRPSPGGDTAVLVETSIEAVADVPAAEIEHLRIALQPELEPCWRHVRLDGGRLSAVGDFTVVDRGAIGDDGGVMVWGNEICTLLVLPLDGRRYEAECRAIESRNGREQVRLTSGLAGLRRGERLETRLLVVLSQRPVSSPDDLRVLRRALVDSGRRLGRVTAGTASASSYPATVVAESGVVAGERDAAAAEEPLPLVVTGLKQTCSCLVVEDGRQRIAEPIDGVVRTVLAPGTLRYAVASPLACDDPSVRLEWAGTQDGDIRFHAHNPGPSAVTCRVRTNSALPGLPAGSTVMALPAGGSGWGLIRPTDAP
jgi:hypothetical protein